MSKLVEAEMDGAAAATQVMALKDTETVGGALGWGGWGCGGKLHAGINQADFLTSPGWGRAHLTAQSQHPPALSLPRPWSLKIRTSVDQGI